MVEVGGITALMQAMEAQPNARDVQSYACYALDQLIHSVANKVPPLPHLLPCPRSRISNVLPVGVVSRTRVFLFVSIFLWPSKCRGRSRLSRGRFSSW
jgi:hypothetical protein